MRERTELRLLTTRKIILSSNIKQPLCGARKWKYDHEKYRYIKNNYKLIFSTCDIYLHSWTKQATKRS